MIKKLIVASNIWDNRGDYEKEEGIAKIFMGIKKTPL
jgi:hypothetical protein